MADKSKTPNYTQEQTDELVTAYAGCETDAERVEVVEEFAERFAKPLQSIRAKLVSEGVYVKKEYKTKRGEKPVSKAAIVANIASSMGVSAETVESLEKANKATLKMIAVFLHTAKEIVNARED